MGEAMGIRKKLASALELQEDVMLNLPLMHLTGGERLVVENHRGIAELDSAHVRIRAAHGSVLVQGERLRVGSLGRDDLVITGNIQSVTMGA
jgi:sporulation protein YqfC